MPLNTACGPLHPMDQKTLKAVAKHSHAALGAAVVLAIGHPGFGFSGVACLSRGFFFNVVNIWFL